MAAVLYTHIQLPTANLGTARSASERAKNATFHPRNCEGRVLKDDIVRALPAAGPQIAVAEAITGQLVAVDSGAFGNREREERKPTHVDLVGNQTGGSADRIVVREFDVRELLIPVSLEHVDHHNQDFWNRMIHTLHPNIAI